MNGLAKIAEIQNINLNNNYSTREDRLLDQFEEARERLEALEAQRDPEVEAAANRKVLNGVLGGVGIGGAIGAGIGIADTKGLPIKTRLAGGAALGLAGGATGLLPGLAVGGILGEMHRFRNENPELLNQIGVAEDAKERSHSQLERHYLMGERFRREEADRAARRKEVLGY